MKIGVNLRHEFFAFVPFARGSMKHYYPIRSLPYLLFPRVYQINGRGSRARKTGGTMRRGYPRDILTTPLSEHKRRRRYTGGRGILAAVNLFYSQPWLYTSARSQPLLRTFRCFNEPTADRYTYIHTLHSRCLARRVQHDVPLESRNLISRRKIRAQFFKIEDRVVTAIGL